MKPFHLGVYSDALQRGGAEVTLAMVLGALPDEIRVSIVTVHDDVAEYLGRHRPSADVHVTPQITGKTDIAGWRRHWRLFRQIRPDLMQFNLGIMSSCQWAILIAQRIPRLPVIAIENSSMGNWSTASHLLKRVTSPRLAMHLAVGEATARIVEVEAKRPPGSVETLYHGVPDLTHIRRSADPHGTTVVNIARRDPVKGVDVLLEAMTLVDEPIRLVQIGDGPETAALTARRDELGLAERVELRELPWSDRAAEGLAAFDLFALASRSEGFPVTIMEAMLAGLPVVATDVGSVREAVVDGETGLVVPPEDPKAMAEAISALMGDPERRAAMGAAARAIAEQRFTVEATVARYLDVYERVLRS